MSDKRSFSRVPVRATVSFELPDASTAVGELLDLSMRGAFVRSAIYPEVGTEGAVVIVFGDSEEPLVIRGRGRVVRHQSEGFALEIFELELDSYHHMQGLIAYNSRAPEDVDEELRAHIGLKPR